MKKLLIFPLLILLSLLGACVDDDAFTGDPRVPMISSIVPDSASVGDTILVEGAQLGNVDSVFFNGAKTRLLSSTENSIIVLVPATASTGPVSAVNEFGLGLGPDFTLIAGTNSINIRLDSVSPNSGTAGDQVILYGTNFQLLAADFSLFFNGIEADKNIITNTEINALVPNDATSGAITINSLDSIISGPLFIIEDQTTLFISSINPTSGPELTEVTISGQNFGAVLADIEVSLNGENAQVNSVSDTEIVFIVPDGATTGAVVVNKISTGQEAEGPIYTVTEPPLVITVSTLVSDGVGNPFDIIELTNFLLIADDAGHRIRLYDLNANQIVATIGNGQAGFTNGSSANAQFNFPSRMAITETNDLVIADRSNHVIRSVTGGIVSTVSGIGQAGFADGDIIQQAQYNTPTAVTIDGSIIYVADFGNHAIRKIDIQNQQVTTIAGNGTPGFVNGNSNNSRLNFPAGIELDGNGNLLIADFLNHSIRSLNLSTLELTTVAGTGVAGFEDGDNATARFSQPIDVDVDIEGNIYVADGLNHSIRMIANGATTTLAGTGVSGNQNGDGSVAQFNGPTSVLAISPTEILVGDYNNNAIKRLVIE